MIVRTLLAALALTVAAGSANAAVYVGNPVIKVVAVHTVESLDGGTASVDAVDFNLCGGGTWTDDTDVDVDLIDGAEWAFPAGDYCSVEIHWSSDVVLDGVNSAGSFVIEATPSSTQIDVDPAPRNSALVPYSVTTGTVSSGHPRFSVTID